MSDMPEQQEKYTSNLEADEEWIEEGERVLAERGWTKKFLAQKLRVDPATVTRMFQGTPVRTGMIYRASLLLGIRTPKSLPVDALQQRMLVALVRARGVLNDDRASNLVSRFEELVAKVVSAIRYAEEESMMEFEPDDEGSMPTLGQADEWLSKVLRPPKPRK